MRNHSTITNAPRQIKASVILLLERGVTAWSGEAEKFEVTEKVEKMSFSHA